MTLLLGPPGCGKTTLLLALSGRLDPSLKVWFLFYHSSAFSFQKSYGLLPLYRLEEKLVTMVTYFRSLFLRKHRAM